MKNSNGGPGDRPSAVRETGLNEKPATTRVKNELADATPMDFHSFPACAQAQNGSAEFALVESIRGG
jgi:hypothetical protein